MYKWPRRYPCYWRWLFCLSRLRFELLASLVSLILITAMSYPSDGPVQYIVVQWPKSNPNFCDITWNVIEKMILHELFRVVSGFPRYIPCYIAKNQFHLGQCTMTNFSDDSDKQYGSIMGRVICQNRLLTPFIQKCNNSWPNLLIHTVTYFFIQKIMNCFFFLRS